MMGAWFVVEVFCFLHILDALTSLRAALRDPVLLAILVGVTGMTILLTFLTFRAKRWASRLLATYIMFSSLYFIWVKGISLPGFDIYRAYTMLMYIYFFVGAIKLWRIKELPTRFTDPPTEPPAHA